MIYTYTQQTVLVTKFSYIKVLSQVSVIDYLIFKQQKTAWVTQKKRFIDKEIYQKWSYGSDIPSEKYPPPLSHPKTSRIYLTPLPPIARDVIYGWSLSIWSI